MKRQLLLIITFLVTNNIVSQTDNKLIIGDLTIKQTTFNNVKVGDTLAFLFVKKPFEGSIKIHSDNSLYAWTTCILGQKKYTWCKIGTWDKNESIVFNLSCKTIILKNISPDIGHGQQKLVIQDIK